MLDESLIKVYGAKLTTNPLNAFIRDKANTNDRPISEVIADILRTKIINGDLLSGSRLVEAEIAKFYGVSRGSVREAFRLLESEGLLEVEKFKSPKVKGVDIKVFIQMFEVRSVLESFACRLAAQNIQQKPLELEWAKLEYEAWKNHEYVNDISLHVKKNSELHAGLLKIADHQLLTDQIDSLLMPGYRAILEPKLTSDDLTNSADQHAEILSAVIDGNGERAELLMRSHIINIGRHVAQNFSFDTLDPAVQELKKLQESI